LGGKIGLFTLDALAVPVKSVRSISWPRKRSATVSIAWRW